MQQKTQTHVDALREPPDFSLVVGGPLYQLFRRAGLSDDGLGLVKRRMVLIPAIAWLPLLVLSAFEGLALGSEVRIPFLLDIEVHARYLVALPILIFAELVVHERLLPVIRTFLKRKLIPDVFSHKLDDALSSAFRLRNSLFAEIFLIVLVFVVGIGFIWPSRAMLRTATWFAMVKEPGVMDLTNSGVWYKFVSIPIFQFFLIRWYFRFVIWIRFLSHIARIKLDLLPLHPDRAAGLGFLSQFVYAFAPILFAHGVLLSGMIANQIFFLGSKLPDFQVEIFLVIVALLLFTLGPLAVFTPQLLSVKRRGLAEYGTLAVQYVKEFDEKWIRNNKPESEPLIGSADIQSLADLANSFQLVREIRIVPFSKEAIFQLALITLLPLLPLTLTMFSLDELLHRFVGTVF